MKLRPSTIHAFEKSGFTSLNITQQSIFDSLSISTDVVCQGKGATGKTSTIALLLSERLLGEGVYFAVVPTLVLKTELLLFLERFLGLSDVGILDAAQARGITSRTTVLVGTPQEFLIASGLMGTRIPKLIVMDEADALFEDPITMSVLLNQYLSPSTKTLSLSATFPPYIMTRIEEALAIADGTRTKEPTRIHHCVSTSTCATKNPVRSNVKYFYTILGEDQTVPDLVASILSNHKHRRALVINCSPYDAKAISRSLSSSAALIVDSSTLNFSSVSQSCLIDPKGTLSRGVNIPGLDLGISIGIHERKETILHQWARVGREPGSSIAPKFFMLLSNANELDQLRFLEFQLGVVFEEYNTGCNLFSLAPTHPFHAHSDTWKRLEAVAFLLARK